MKQLRQTIAALLRRRKADRQERKTRQLLRNAEEEIQVIEFDGKLYIAYHGTPLIEEAKVAETLLSTLPEVRRTLVTYRLKQMQQ